jgi:hypothetical protein
MKTDFPHIHAAIKTYSNALNRVEGKDLWAVGGFVRSGKPIWHRSAIAGATGGSPEQKGPKPTQTITQKQPQPSLPGGANA